jgi:hypothetical protein
MDHTENTHVFRIDPRFTFQDNPLFTDGVVGLSIEYAELPPASIIFLCIFLTADGGVVVRSETTPSPRWTGRRPCTPAYVSWQLNRLKLFGYWSMDHVWPPMDLFDGFCMHVLARSRNDDCPKHVYLDSPLSTGNRRASRLGNHFLRLLDTEVFRIPWLYRLIPWH